MGGVASCFTKFGKLVSLELTCYHSILSKLKEKGVKAGVRTLKKPKKNGKHLQLMRWLGCILQLLDEIAAKFYNIQRQNPLEGLFGEMFKVPYLVLLVCLCI